MARHDTEFLRSTLETPNVSELTEGVRGLTIIRQQSIGAW